MSTLPVASGTSAIALLLNIVFDDSPGEYVALAFAIAALACAVGYLARPQRHRSD
ncbi:hypothetical protein [Brachybacterium sp. UNK5269]|uniref:hypothetical protein n=1 Tax=Brachybacterium sp. UNK5269 TaxID=3408576 RepID=UPI003BAF0518